MRRISSTSYTVIINSSWGRMFQPTRDLRQGDPFNPFLFLFCSEGLSTLMRLAIEEGHLRGEKSNRNGPPISHLLFADDSIIFKEATTADALDLKKILLEYERCSG